MVNRVRVRGEHRGIFDKFDLCFDRKKEREEKDRNATFLWRLEGVRFLHRRSTTHVVEGTIRTNGIYIITVHKTQHT